MTRFIYVLVTITIGFIANAQDLEKSLLWKISGNGIEKPSYLFGTIHATCEVNFDEATLKALDETKQMYLEIDLDDPNLQALMMKGMYMKDNKTISSFLNEEDNKIVDAFLKENTGMSIKLVDRFVPFIISSMLIPKIIECPMQSIEMELVNISKEQKEEIFGLESISDQMKVFNTIPYDVQIDELVKTAKSNLVKDKEEYKKMLAVYEDKDIESLLKMMDVSENKISSDFDDILLNDRNANWIPIIEKIAKEQPTFIGVGAGHLAGEKGVIKLLRKKGYKVEAVK